MRLAVAALLTAILAVPGQAIAQTAPMPPPVQGAQPAPVQPASAQANPVQTKPPQSAPPVQRPRLSSPILNEDADIDKGPPPVPFVTWLYDLIFKVRRPDDASYTLRAPFIRPKDLKTPTAIRMGLPYGEDVETGMDASGLSVAHRSEDQVGDWLIGRVSDILNVRGDQWKDHLQLISSLMTKPALDSYSTWMQDSELLGRLYSNNLHIRAYVDDAPLLLNQGVVDGRYRWLYEVHATLTFYTNAAIAAEAKGDKVADMGGNMKIVMQAQVGRVAEIDATDDAYDEDPSHHITASKVGLQPLTNAEGLALESWNVQNPIIAEADATIRLRAEANQLYPTPHSNQDRSRPMADNVTQLKPDETTDMNGVSGQRLKAYLERIERLEEEKKGLADDIKDIYAEAKGFGFDVKTLRAIVRLRKVDAEKRREADELLDLYKAALGME